MVNTTKIKARIIEVGLTQTAVAAALHIAQSTLNQKINNTRPMTLDEAEELQKILSIPDPEFCAYFFSSAVA